MTTSSTRPLDGTRGVVRVEDVYDTDVADLWDACTRPERLARWIARVEGDELHEGGTVQAVYTSSWSGPVRIDVCEAPTHLRLTSGAGTDEETVTEAWLTAEGERTRLVVEERGLPLAALHFYSAGWSVHLEDLGRALATDAPVYDEPWSAERPSAGWHARWQVLSAEHAPAGS